MGELRIFHTADWHLGKTIDGSGRTPDHERFFEDFFALAQSRRPDVLLMAGDIFHRPNRMRRQKPSGGRFWKGSSPLRSGTP